MAWRPSLDLVMPVWRPRAMGYPDAVLQAGVRLEHVDFNRGSFDSTGDAIRDDQTAVVAGLSFRPSPGTVFRGNYRFHWTRDFPGNPAARAAGIQLGFATYF